ncbi:CidA/LrgA family protein [Propionivibrio soli]|uniref:CidA/LrgA family protein n=1 Tax=Propionivibrio soli TaxID=2976531 RepID=UPI0021E8A1DB|nr:CidA/LrgA family protein [Propionivibrio soli]
MLTGFLRLLAFLVAGESVVYLLALPLPGAVVGMAFLLIWLLWRGHAPSENLTKAANGLLQYLSLFFVPAGVGVILHFERLQREWPAIVSAIVFATLVSAAFTALLLKALAGRKNGQESRHG